MDRIINTKTERQSIYEIYRACRLCGAGAGYKMPIIQNVVDMDTNGIELSQKIRDCVQIEVHPEDKMPPLICELCVDKVNDFYEFMELCQRTNKQTRMRLGLPLHTSTRTVNSDSSSVNSGDCILGVTEPVYQNDDSNEPLAPTTRRSKQTDGKLNKNIKKESSPKQKRPPTPPRPTRQAKTSSEDTMSLSSLKQQTKKTSKAASTPQPKSILKKETAVKKETTIKKEKREESPVPVRTKRPREMPKPEIPQKKVKLSVPPSRKPCPRSRRPPSPAPAPAEHACPVCARVNSTPQALASHLRAHTVTYTSAKLACNACQQWFASYDAAQAHHKWHRTKHRAYRCARCRARHASLAAYTGHIENGECIPWEEVPDKKCDECWKTFPTDNLLRSHQCAGEDARPGGKCSNCKRTYALLKNLKKHEASCTPKKKAEIKVEPSVRARLLPLRVRVARCDALLRGRGRVRVRRVAGNYGLDRSCYYPYLKSCIVKSELPEDSMVKIKAELDDYEIEDFVHWDSDSESDDEQKTVNSLTTLSLKKIFSKNYLGKVPRKRRKVKMEKNAFDSMLNESDFENSMNRDINHLIDNLGNDIWGNDKNNDEHNASDEESLLTNYVLFDDTKVSNNEKTNDFEDSNDSQSIFDLNAKSTDETSVKNNDVSSDSCKNLDGDTTDKKDMIDEAEKDNAQEISAVTSGGNNDESSKNQESTAESTDTRKESDIQAGNLNHDKNNDAGDSVSINTISRIDSKDLSTENTSNNINNEMKPESTNDDNLNENCDENTNTDCKADINNRCSSENTKNSLPSDTDNVYTNSDSIVKNDSQNTNNDNKSANAHEDNVNDDTKITSNPTRITNADKKITNNDKETMDMRNKNDGSSSGKAVNGIVEEKSDKLNFGDMNDVSDTEIEDKKLMDALNEQLGETDGVSDNFNEETETQYNKQTKGINEKNDKENNEQGYISQYNEDNDTEDLNKNNGAKNTLSNSCQNETDTNHGKPLSDHEKAINDLLNENNDVNTKNYDDNNKDDENKGNECDTEKISLEDLLPTKCDTKSMDLDSISDDEFDFDAC